MIDDSSIIKYLRANGFRNDWPLETRRIKKILEDIKKGFPGIGNNHLSLVKFKDIKINDIFITSRKLNSGLTWEYQDEAPLMLRVLETSDFHVEGIGCGTDTIRDPNLDRIRWKDLINFNMVSLNLEDLVLRVDVRPTENGGPGYYYFYRSIRDFRV